jgi:hypothetical protein
MSASPVVGRSTGLCHNRRHVNCSAQKQIICPIYSGAPPKVTYGMGGGTGFPIQNNEDSLFEKVNKDSFV